jgi:uncharacterized small protein (DUF1192 family)
MDWDEPKAKSQRQIAVGEELSSLSIADLEERIARLRDEIARIEATLAARRKHGAAAAELFGRKT